VRFYVSVTDLHRVNVKVRTQKLVGLKFYQDRGHILASFGETLPVFIKVFSEIRENRVEIGFVGVVLGIK